MSSDKPWEGESPSTSKSRKKASPKTLQTKSDETKLKFLGPASKALVIETGDWVEKGDTFLVPKSVSKNLLNKRQSDGSRVFEEA